MFSIAAWISNAYGVRGRYSSLRSRPPDRDPKAMQVTGAEGCMVPEASLVSAEQHVRGAQRRRLLALPSQWLAKQHAHGPANALCTSCQVDVAFSRLTR